MIHQESLTPHDEVSIGGVQLEPVHDRLFWKPHWTFTRYASEADYEAGNPYNTTEVDGNLLLNEGITLLLNLLVGAGGTVYSTANAYIGVGDSTTAASASQTALQAASNKAWHACSVASVSSQTVTFTAAFASGEANYDWREFTVVNASTDSGTNLNRLVSTQGTKASGQVWTVSVAITVS